MSETASVADVPAQTIDVAGTPVALRRRGEGRPLLFLHGAAKERAAYLGLDTWAISLTHSRQLACAMVVASKGT